MRDRFDGKASARLGPILAALAIWFAGASANAADSAASSAPAPAPAKASPPTATAPAPAAAPAAPAAVAPPAFPATADQQALGQLQNQYPATTNDARLAAMGVQAADIETQADQALAKDDTALAALDKTLHLSPGHHRRKLTAAEQKADAPLLAQQTVLAGQVGQLKAVAAEAGGVFSQIAERRRQSFSARVLEHSPSPLTPDFWDSLNNAASDDLDRLATLLDRSVAAASHAPIPRGPLGLCGSLLAALIMVWPLRLWMEHWGRRKDAALAHTGRARRTLGAVWIALVDVGAPTIAMATVQAGAEWGQVVSGDAAAVTSALVGAVAWSSAILALGRVMATDREADRRLMKLTDEDAKRIRWSLWPVALITGAGFIVRRLNYTIGATVAATIAANCILSLAYAAAAALILFSVSARKPGEGEEDEAAELARSPVWTLISLALALAIGVTVLAVLAGYTTLAALISGQMFWLSLIGGMTFLLLRLIDDLFTALFRDTGPTVRTLTRLFGLKRSTILQVGLLISAALQVVVALTALSLALTPYGQGGELLFSHFSRLGGEIHVGKAVISPNAIAAGIVAFAVGMGIVHVIRGWVVRRYLPATDWDAGVRNSVSTGVGYLGVAITLVCAFAAMGLGFEQIALIASALSVGIGFGLQQIVQNFVAGIILLIERPVKVGDWVNVGGVEGDVRRIRVRATEIQAFDRSTVIVPNSNLITLNVQNKTLGDTRGRIQLQMTIAKPGDARKAADLIIEAAKARPDILTEPKPAIYVDSMATGGGVLLNGYVYVASPRDSYRVRSELYFQILEAFQAHEIGLL